MDKQYHNTWSEINTNNIIKNTKSIIKHSAKTTNLDIVYAVVKANGYGHGIMEVAKAVLEGGANALAVANLTEALKLRERFINTPILVLEPINPKHVHIASKSKIELTICSDTWLSNIIKEKPKSLDLHLLIDTAMNRLGVKSDDEISSILVQLQTIKTIKLVGAYTHFATADNDDDTLLLKQIGRLKKKLNLLKNLNIKYIHAPNSAALINHLDKMPFINGARIGLSLYGISEVNKGTEIEIDLKPALSLYSTVLQVKKITKGESVSYGANYIAEENEIIATVAIGYADGVNRNLSGYNLTINNKQYPIVGDICMNLLMLKVDETVKVGDKVEIIGATNTAKKMASYLNTISYEIITTISERVLKQYTKN